MKNTFSLRLSKNVVKLCKLHSVKYDNCPCPNEGSAAHFVKVAVFKELIKYVPKEYLVKVFGE